MIKYTGSEEGANNNLRIRQDWLWGVLGCHSVSGAMLGDVTIRFAKHSPVDLTIRAEFATQ